jgi:Carboxypeptidase regulatory-like domain
VNRSRVPATMAIVSLAALTFSVLSAVNVSAAIPSRPTPVFVHPDKVTSKVNQALQPASTIAGTVTAVAGGAPVRAEVVLLDAAGGEIGHAVSKPSTGSYLLSGLLPATGKYHVCVEGLSATGGGSTTGYLGTCYPAVAWPRETAGPLPAAASAVRVGKGKQVTGINVALPSAAAIGGTITDQTDAPVGGVRVVMVNPDDGTKYETTTGGKGHYLQRGLTASATGYTVCFDASRDATGTGLISECNQDVPWNGLALPAGTMPVPVIVGTLHSGIDASLAPGGAIVGQITTGTSTPQPFANVPVTLFGGGSELLTTTTHADGGYKFAGLPTASGYHVCAGGYALSQFKIVNGQCFNGIAWSGSGAPAGSSTAVSVTAGKTHSAVRFSLEVTTKPHGSISGTIRDAAGTAVGGATISIFNASRLLVTKVVAGKHGDYIVNLPKSRRGYIICAQAPSRTVDPSEPPVGWEPRCHGRGGTWEGGVVPPPKLEKRPKGMKKPTPGTVAVQLKAGQAVVHLNIRLLEGAAIKGHAVTSGSAAHGIDRVRVLLFDEADLPIASTTTHGPKGTFEFTRLLAPTAVDTVRRTFPPWYYVCFDGRGATGTGYLPRCFHNIAWNGTS